MARDQSESLRIYTAAGTTLQRWQSFYSYRSVVWDNATWEYQQFTADGFTAGASGDETNVLVSAPATPIVTAAFETAIFNGQFVEMLQYEFAAVAGGINPSEGQALIAAFNGQVVGGMCSATNFTLQLGSALSPVGAQFPPRKLTTAIMGQGCRL